MGVGAGSDLLLVVCRLDRARQSVRQLLLQTYPELCICHCRC